jgi:hypothetical protein
LRDVLALALGTMKKPHPLGDFKKLLLRKKLEEIVAIPATLYFPASIVAQLNEICDQSGYTPGQLIVKALKGQIYHWDRFYQYVTTPPEKPEDFICPEDPLFCLAYATTVHFHAKRLRSHRFCNRKSMRRPNSLSVLLKNKTKMIRPTGGKRLSDSRRWFARIVCDASSLLDQAFLRRQTTEANCDILSSS